MMSRRAPVPCAACCLLGRSWHTAFLARSAPRPDSTNRTIHSAWWGWRRHHGGLWLLRSGAGSLALGAMLAQRHRAPEGLTRLLRGESWARPVGRMWLPSSSALQDAPEEGARREPCRSQFCHRRSPIRLLVGHASSVPLGVSSHVAQHPMATWWPCVQQLRMRTRVSARCWSPLLSLLCPGHRYFRALVAAEPSESGGRGRVTDCCCLHGACARAGQCCCGAFYPRRSSFNLVGPSVSGPRATPARQYFMSGLCQVSSRRFVQRCVMRHLALPRQPP